MHVKIIASLGPSTREESIIERLILLGATGFRINFAHGDPSFWEELIKAVRGAEEKLGRPVAIMGDLVGPSIRLGILEEPVTLNPGDKASIVLAEHAKGRKEAVIPLPLERFFAEIEEGDIIIMDDGRVRLRVIEVAGDQVIVEALTPARITSRKAIVVQGKEFSLPAITERDLEAIDFAVRNDFDYISLSYVRDAEDLRVLRKIVHDKGGEQAIAAKIETRSAVENLEQIVEEADLVVVARGDLGMNYGLEEVPLLQERIIDEARRRGRPVVVATQVLESMVNSPTPTRAEVTDVYVAVSQGVDAIMLTGETAIGRYPVETIKWLRKILRRAEENIAVNRYPPQETRWAYANSIVETAEAIGADAILVFSMGGSLPPKIAASRPYVRTVIGTPSKRIARKLSILWRLDVLLVNAGSYEEGLARLEEELCRKGELSIGDTVIEAYRSNNENRVIIKQILSCQSGVKSSPSTPS